MLLLFVVDFCIFEEVVGNKKLFYFGGLPRLFSGGGTIIIASSSLKSTALFFDLDFAIPALIPVKQPNE
jgi:hypothetical protein